MTISNVVNAATIAMHWDHMLAPSDPNSGKTLEDSWLETAKKAAGLVLFAISCGLIGFKSSLLLFGLGGTYHFYHAYQKAQIQSQLPCDEKSGQETGALADDDKRKPENTLMKDFGDKIPAHMRRKVVQEVSTLLDSWSHYFPNPSKELINFLIDEYTKKEVTKEASATSPPIAHSKASIGNVTQVSEGVYTAEGTTANGEKIYFGIEQLDFDTLYWEEYQKACKRLYDNSRGLLNYLGLYLNDDSKLAEIKKDKKNYGLESHEFKEFVQKMKQREVYKGGRRWETLQNTSGGAESFKLMLKRGNFVAYVSKLPIKGRADFPESLEEYPWKLKEIYETCGDTLMTVGVRNIDVKPMFENRGIFRNPLSLIEGGYPNLSMQLHAFVGKAFKTHINSNLGVNAKMYMTVFPLKQMESILLKTVGRSRVSIDHDLPPELYLEESSKRASGEKQLLISLDELASLFG
ncbi:hypothetical protein [Simkania sp.]|uniref:hypothetical protein n=1 Tax=Simkania sp. TaxID=34094 RepID=UPI003B51875D